MTELFKWVTGYEDFYLISNYGFVTSLNSQDGKERILKHHLDKYGYPRTILCVNDIRKGFTVHRLVAKAFIPNPLDLPQVNHINGIKTDNRVKNLEWCDNAYNREHAISTGLWNSVGELNKSSTLKEVDVLEIRRLKEETKISSYVLAERYNVNYSCIHKILKRETWKHI